MTSKRTQEIKHRVAALKRQFSPFPAGAVITATDYQSLLDVIDLMAEEIEHLHSSIRV